MRILIVTPQVIPAIKYGGTERVMTSLATALNEMGHKVTIMALNGSSIPALGVDVKLYDPTIDLSQQIDCKHYDVAHLNWNYDGQLNLPTVETVHGNASMGVVLSRNSIFISRNHAQRHGSDCFVYNGLDWSQYGDVDLSAKRSYFHFLGKAAWRVKNIEGAIDVVLGSRGAKLEVLGGSRLNIKMGFRFTTSPRIHFHGMVDNSTKSKIMAHSRGLIFPVRWSEPFGLALIESLYFGCPVFGTPYGSLPEIVTEQYGVLSASQRELTDAISECDKFDPAQLHNYAATTFDAHTMAHNYLQCYQKVVDGEYLNSAAPTLQQQPPKFLDWQ